MNKKPKSFARELAVIIFVFWSYAVMNLPSETIEAITPWVFIYGLGAFGLDKYGKQVKDAKNSHVPPQE